MKKTTTTNYNGIVICDSITMSVKKKKSDMRSLLAVLIAVTGFASVILSFLGMFDFSYSDSSVVSACILSSVTFITLNMLGRYTKWFVGGSFVIFVWLVYRNIQDIVTGYKFTYNVIYSVSTQSETRFYKFLDMDDERKCITTFFVFCIWLIALCVYTFTISKPNPIPIILVTFPPIEIGLYNGIDIPVIWGILTVAYWFAVLGMFCTDFGEYSGGSGGFVRKENLFFPKRQMRLKVTEQCAVIVISCAVILAVGAVSVMKLSGYKRSEELNEKRADIKEAINNFSMDDVATSLSAITESFGFTLTYETYKLGNVSRVKYKNTTDLVAIFYKPYDGAIYLKGYAGSVYGDNEWTELPDKAYNEADALFNDFRQNDIYPQDFPYLFSDSAESKDNITLWIEAKRKLSKSYAPYGTLNYGDMKYTLDTVVSSKEKDSTSYSYKFTGVEADKISLPADTDTTASQLEERYSEFVYRNYLQIPAGEALNEVREEYSDIIKKGQYADTMEEQLELLNELRSKLASETEYSLKPGKTPSSRDFVNYFLLENKKGYCAHYATAGVILARMAGIPARYATGYIIVSDDFNEGSENDDGSYTINVKDDRSHAWAEVYIDGFGWVPFEFTAGYSSNAIVTETTTTTTENSTNTVTTTTVKNTEPSSKNTTRRNSSSKPETTAAVTTAKAVGTTPVHAGTGRCAGGTAGNSPAYDIILTVFIAVLAVFTVWLRRYLILKRRDKLFRTGKNKKRVVAMYSYTERLLKMLKLRRGRLMYIEYADSVEDTLKGKYFSEGSFRSFMETVLLGSYSDNPPDDSQTESALAFTADFAQSVYKNSNPFIKIYMKLIAVLI